MALPKFLQSALYSYDLKFLDVKKDSRLIVNQILNHGNWNQLRWLRRTYRLEKIKEIVRSPERGSWHKDALNYWLTIFDIKLPQKKISEALFSLTPIKR